MPEPLEKSRAPRRDKVAAALLSGLGVRFTVLNSDSVRINWIVTTTKAPLIVVIALCVLVGAGVGLLGLRSRRR